VNRYSPARTFRERRRPWPRNLRSGQGRHRINCESKCAPPLRAQPLWEHGSAHIAQNRYTLGEEIDQYGLVNSGERLSLIKIGRQRAATHSQGTDEGDAPDRHPTQAPGRGRDPRKTKDIAGRSAHRNSRSEGDRNPSRSRRNVCENKSAASARRTVRTRSVRQPVVCRKLIPSTIAPNAEERNAGTPYHAYCGFTDSSSAQSHPPVKTAAGWPAGPARRHVAEFASLLMSPSA
jgi:hypothetical protein